MSWQCNRKTELAGNFFSILKLPLMHFSIVVGCHAGRFSEIAVECRYFRISRFHGDLQHGFFGILTQIIFDQIDFFFENEITDVYSAVFFEIAADVKRRVTDRGADFLK